MAVLVLAEVVDGNLNAGATAKTVAAVRSLCKVTVLCAGSSVSDAAAMAAKIEGVTKVAVADIPALAHQLAEPLATLIVALAKDYEHIVAPVTATGKSVLPRVAALLDVMIIPDVSKVIDGKTFERPIYAGNAIQTVESSDAVKVLTVRTASFTAAGEQAAAPIEAATEANDPGLSQWVEDKIVVSERPELTSAGIVVSGGRALGSRENFALIEKLASKLGAAVGASRAAVDAGYVASDLQVGQTGKIVAPELYIAIGISGAIQHVAGMKDAKIIVAINKDAEAPIFQIADYGLVGDLFTTVPELIEKL
jgi:electron transfer flavoprotein alpha subunit